MDMYHVNPARIWLPYPARRSARVEVNVPAGVGEWGRERKAAEGGRGRRTALAGCAEGGAAAVVRLCMR